MSRSRQERRAHLWGLVAVGLFSDGSYGAGWNGVGATDYLGKAGQGVTGLLYGDSTQLIAQLAEAGAGVAWNVIMGGVFFVIVGKLVGGNRVSAEVEVAGLDVPEMGVPGYPEFLPPISPEAAAAELNAVRAADAGFEPAKVVG